MNWWVWVVFGLGLSAIELVTPGGFVVIFFGVSAVAVGLLTGVGLASAPWLQWLLFPVLALVALRLFRTPLLEELPAEAQAALGASIPYPARLGEPEEFAALVAAMITNPYLNGEVVRLDGALRMAPR